MKAVVTVEVKHDGTAKALITNVTDPADKEFNNTVRPPETPDFNPEKYILNESKFDLTGVKLLDDDNELEHKSCGHKCQPICGWYCQQRSSKHQYEDTQER